MEKKKSSQDKSRGEQIEERVISMRDTLAKELDFNEGASVVKYEDKNLKTTKDTEMEDREIDDPTVMIILSGDENELEDDLNNISIHDSILD